MNDLATSPQPRPEDPELLAQIYSLFREYFDLREDPWQLENLLAPGSQDGPSERQVQKLSRRLDRFYRCEGSDCP